MAAPITAQDSCTLVRGRRCTAQDDSCTDGLNLRSTACDGCTHVQGLTSTVQPTESSKHSLTVIKHQATDMVQPPLQIYHKSSSFLYTVQPAQAWYTVLHTASTSTSSTANMAWAPACMSRTTTTSMGWSRTTSTGYFTCPGSAIPA